MTMELSSRSVGENSSANIALALEMLLEEVEKEIGFVNRDGANAFASGDYGVARKSLQRSEVLMAFRDKVDSSV